MLGLRKLNAVTGDSAGVFCIPVVYVVLLDKNILKGSMSVLNLHIKCMDISTVLACASEN